MYIQPTKGGGRRIGGDTPWGKWRVYADASADGKPLRLVDAEGREYGTATIEIKTPPENIETYDWRGAAKRLRHGVVGMVKSMFRIDETAAEVYRLRVLTCEGGEGVQRCTECVPCKEGSEHLCCGPMLNAVKGGKGCGCPIRKKASVASERCPLSKW